MNTKASRALALLLILALSCALLSGCKKKDAPLPDGAAHNDILTFTDNAANKRVVRIGMQYYTPDQSLVNALNAAFPDCLFVMDYGAAAGLNSEYLFAKAIEEGRSGFDLLVSGNMDSYNGVKDKLFVDLSAESFLDNYLLSALNNISIDGHIYSIPGTCTLAGIAFNADLFEKNGWAVPRTHDEFFALCETIRAAGIEPFSLNAKYLGQLFRLPSMMYYAELFGSVQGIKWLAAVQRGEDDFKGFMEPLYTLIKRFTDAACITIEDFTASLTKQRQDFWAGQYAMIEYDSAIFTYAASENAPFNVGIMPYPAANAENAGYAITPEYYVYITKECEKDPQKLALLKDVLAFISSEPGQRAMLGDSLRISNVIGVDLRDNPAMKYAREAFDRGNLYPSVRFDAVAHVPFLALNQNAAKMLCEGAGVDEVIQYIDAGVDEAFASGAPEPVQYQKIAAALEPFTMLETSYYIADQFRKATGADIGLMINRGYFRSNLAAIEKGDINDNLERYVMKGIGANDFLTTYHMTGAQLMALLEHPVINGDETDALIAASGLKMEYAPWNARGKRVIKVTLADGKELKKDQLYTVAAWAGAVDAQYITYTANTHEALGDITQILGDAFRRDGEIKPDIKDRLTLVWPKVK